MHDARDAEDALLLESGDHGTLIAAYVDVVVQRCLVATRDEAGYDVAQNVFLRLLSELERGRRYGVPYRVVVHKVVDWTLKEHFLGRSTAVPLAEGWDAADPADPYVDVDEGDLGSLWADLPEGDRLVLDLRYVDGLEIQEVADRLGKTRNAVDQALHRAHAKLRKLIDDG
jgi:RNA polymerase sigma-70 factor (ECF subfamily)